MSRDRELDIVVVGRRRPERKAAVRDEHGGGEGENVDQHGVEAVGPFGRDVAVASRWGVKEEGDG